MKEKYREDPTEQRNQTDGQRRDAHIEINDVTQLDAIDVTHTFEIDDVLQIVAIDVKEPAEKFKKVGFPRASARSASSSSR